MRQQLGVAAVNPQDTVVFNASPRTLIQGGIPFVLGPSGTMKNNGVVILGQVPANSATLSFSATSGSGVTLTASAVCMNGSALDVGRVFTILDTTYKYATVTAFSSTTVATVTISGGTLSSTGPFANNAVWESVVGGPAAGAGGYSCPLPRAVGNCYSYFPAGALYSGSAAGWYWTNWLSTTVGTVYNNTYSSGQPAVVASPTAFSTTGPGVFTQTNSTNLSAVSYSVPGNSMGKNGLILLNVGSSCSNNPDVKSLVVSFGATNITQVNDQGSTGSFSIAQVQNQGVTNAQISMYAQGGGYGSSTVITGQVGANDTTASQNLVIKMGLNNSSNGSFDYNILEMYSAVLYPSF